MMVPQRCICRVAEYNNKINVVIPTFTTFERGTTILQRYELLLCVGRLMSGNQGRITRRRPASDLQF